MVSPDQPAAQAVQVRVVAGWTEKGTFLLVPGTKPVSVGTQAQWLLFAEGVAPVHLYFAFDGVNVYVAPASPAQTVLLAGTPLGPGWTTAKVPSEIRFAAATLILEPALGVSVPTSSAPSSPNTVSDGGALWEAAQRAVQVAQASPQALAPQTRPSVPAPSEAASPLGPLASTIVMVPNPAAGALLSDALRSQPQVQGTVVAPSGAGFASAPDASAPAGSGLASPPPRRPSVPPGYIGSGLPQETALAPDWVQPPQAPPLTSEQPSSATTEPEAKAGFWKGTSGAKKATLLLMPLVLVASYYLLFSDPGRQPTAQRTKPLGTAPTASPSGNGGASKDALKSASSHATAINEASRPDAGAPVATGATGASNAGGSSAGANAGGAANARNVRPAGTVTTPAGKTPERAALDQVAAGSFDEAARAYDALAAQHPDDLTLREAARVLHEKAERPQR